MRVLEARIFQAIEAGDRSQGAAGNDMSVRHIARGFDKVWTAALNQQDAVWSRLDIAAVLALCCSNPGMPTRSGMCSSLCHA